jgi:hypothetical protein
MVLRYTDLPSKYSFSGKHIVKRYAKRNEAEKLGNIPAYTLHKPVKHKYLRRRVLISKP